MFCLLNTHPKTLFYTNLRPATTSYTCYIPKHIFEGWHSPNDGPPQAARSKHLLQENTDHAILWRGMSWRGDYQQIRDKKSDVLVKGIEYRQYYTILYTYILYIGIHLLTMYMLNWEIIRIGSYRYVGLKIGNFVISMKRFRWFTGRFGVYVQTYLDWLNAMFTT